MSTYLLHAIVVQHVKCPVIFGGFNIISLLVVSVFFTNFLRLLEGFFGRDFRGFFFEYIFLLAGKHPFPAPKTVAL